MVGGRKTMHTPKAVFHQKKTAFTVLTRRNALSRFFAELPTGDLTFIEEDVTDPAQVRSLAASARDRWLAVDDRVPEHFTVTGYLAVRRLPGWSDHVGQIRLVVHPAHRRAGLGLTLARHALIRAVEAGLRKLVVELVADQEHAIGMFTALGFTGETLLRDHIRDRDGRLRDLVVLAHYVEETWAAMTTVGLPRPAGRSAYFVPHRTIVSAIEMSSRSTGLGCGNTSGSGGRLAPRLCCGNFPRR